MRGAPHNGFSLTHSSDDIAQLALDPGPSCPAAGFPAPIAPEPCPMPAQDRSRLNDPDQTEQARPHLGQPYQQRAITAPQPDTCRSSSQCDVELMTEKEVLGLKSAPRLEQIGDVRS
jgi:hypothetical protein